MSQPERASNLRERLLSVLVGSGWRTEAAYFGIFAAVTVGLLWNFVFTSGDIISHGDVNAFYGEGHRLHDKTRYLFNDYGSLSNMENFNTTLLLRPIVMILSVLGIFSDVNQYRAGTLVFIVVSYGSITVFLRWLMAQRSSAPTRFERPAIFAGSIFYVFSPYILNVYPAGGFWLAYALTPIFVVAIYKLTQRRTPLAWLIGLALVASFMVVGTQYLFFSAFIALVIGAIEIFKRLREPEPRSPYLRALVLRVLLVGAVFLALNAHWLMATGAIYGAGAAIDPGYTVDEMMVQDLGARANLLTTAVSADSWTQVNENRYELLNAYGPGANLARYVLVIVSLIGVLILGRHLPRRITLTLFGLFLLFWSLSIGLRNPLYDWLIFDSPISAVGWIFRSPSKLTYIFWLFYAIGFTVFAERLLSIAKPRLRVLVVPLLVVAVMAPSFNKLHSIFSYYFVPTDLPSEYKELYGFLENQPDTEAAKTMYLAPYAYGFGANELAFEASFTWEPGKMVGQVIEQSSPVPTIGYWHYTYRNWQQTLYRAVYPEFSSPDPNAEIPPDIGARYLAPANVRYLVFHNDIAGAVDAGTQSVQRLEQTDLELVRRFGDFIYVFENPNFSPLLSLDNGTPVEWNKIDPTRYEFKADLQPGQRVRFAQTYDALWQMEVDGKTYRPEKWGELDLTAFDPGDGRVEGTITYVPQRAHEIGVYISMTSLLLCAGFLLTRGVRTTRLRRTP